jgi:hypothetical protein
MVMIVLRLIHLHLASRIIANLTQQITPQLFVIRVVGNELHFFI